MFQNLRDFISIPGVWAEEKKRTAHQKLQERSKLKYDTQSGLISTYTWEMKMAISKL